RNPSVRAGGREVVGELLRALFDAALAAADPVRAIRAHMPQPVAGRTVVVGAGKASAAMAHGFEEAWPDPRSGLRVTRPAHGAACGRSESVGAGPPVPDAAGGGAARRILALARSLGPDDQLVCLLSGGGSALLALPAPGLTLADKQEVTRVLLRSG